MEKYYLNLFAVKSELFNANKIQNQVFASRQPDWTKVAEKNQNSWLLPTAEIKLTTSSLSV
jgi:hypothetical protein